MSNGRRYVDTLTAETEVQIGTGAERAGITAGPQGAQIDRAFQVDGAFGAAASTTVGDLTLDTTQYYGFVDATAAPRSANLPASTGLPIGRSYLVQKVDASGNAVTLTPDGGDTINGAATFVLATQFAGAIVSWNGVEWKAIPVGTSGGGGGATTRLTGVSTSYTVLVTDSVIVVKRTATTAMTVDLPAATGSGREIIVKRHVGDLSASLTLDASGAELIDGKTTLIMSAAQVGPSATIKDDVAGEWIII